MSESLKHVVRAAVLRLLDPLVKLLLEAGIGVGEVFALIKTAYVRAAREQARAAGGEMRRPNASRIAVVTGLTRVEVAAILAADEVGEPAPSDRGRPRAERVLSGWWNDPDFQNESREPAILPIQGTRRSFAALCQRYSGERRTAPVLDELLRVRAVRRLKDGSVEAVSRTYATVRWDPEGIAAVGDQLREHCETLVHNLKHPSRPRFVRRVLNSRLDPRYAPMLMRDIEQHAGSVVDSIDDALNAAQYTVKATRGAGDAMTLGVAIYVFEDPRPTEAPDVADRPVPPVRARERHRGRKRRKGSQRGAGAR